jgi:hypothetical protein
VFEIDWVEGDRLREALLGEEQRANDRMMLMLVLMVTGAFPAGYGLSAWASSRAVNAYEWCFVHGVVENGRVYCDMTGFGRWHADKER